MLEYIETSLNLFYEDLVVSLSPYKAV